MSIRRLTVQGHDWTVTERTGERGIYDFEWLTGPHPYGFTAGMLGDGLMNEADLESAIADFLAQINPETGYLD
ncbi:hypothetical protein [Cryptosporangium minutisporangium]|uniref:hypothetical protein n=1 Tax=Cryptosporangium minutisporangium TaxID=113569 RepID=UPI0031E5CD65